MDESPILILSGFLLLILLTLAAVRTISTGASAPEDRSSPRHAKTQRKQLQYQQSYRLLRFLLVIAASLAPLQAISMTLHILNRMTYQSTIPVIIPTLGAILTITLVRWSSFRELGQEGRSARTGLLAALLVVNGANLAVYPNLALTLLAMSAFIALVWVLGTRLGDRLLGPTSLYVVIWFMFYTSGALNSLLPPPTQTVYFLIYLINTAVSTLTILLPALLLWMLLNAQGNRLRFVLHLLTGLVLLSLAIYSAYRGALITSQKPYLAAAEYYPFTQLLTCTVSGLLLAVQSEHNQRLVGPAYAIFLSILLVLASNLGWVLPATAAIHYFLA